MTSESSEAVRSALQRMVADTAFPYARVTASLARHEQQAKAEREWWSTFLPGRSGPTATRDVAPPPPRQLSVSFGPEIAGPLAGGEIVRTWVPAVDDDPGVYGEVLLIGADTSDRFHGLHLTSTSHRGAHRYFAIGAGPKDDHGRFSWVDTDHLLSVHAEGVRRSGFAIDRAHFLRIADELYRRYTWPMLD